MCELVRSRGPPRHAGVRGFRDRLEGRCLRGARALRDVRRHVWGTCTRWTATPNTVARDGGVHTAAGLAISCGEGTRTSMRPRDLVGGAWQRHGAPSIGWYRPSVGVPQGRSTKTGGEGGDKQVSHSKFNFHLPRLYFFSIAQSAEPEGGGGCSAAAAIAKPNPKRIVYRYAHAPQSKTNHYPSFSHVHSPHLVTLRCRRRLFWR